MTFNVKKAYYKSKHFGIKELTSLIFLATSLFVSYKIYTDNSPFEKKFETLYRFPLFLRQNLVHL